MSLEVRCFSKAIQNENTYVITDRYTGYKAVIDPGYYGEDVRTEISDIDSLKYILLTHGHYDHFAAAQEYIDEYPSAVFAAPLKEEYLLHGGRDNKWLALGHGSPVCPDADLRLKAGDTITLGGTVLKVIETPGHTEGGICFCTDSEVFTGDTLFRMSIGNYSLETGNLDELVSSIQTRLYSMDDDVIVWPGHGPATTIGYEKRNNPFVQGEEFI
ncbi:MAG: MBL fold metallo-hydrolase [Mogibacterium sp.]|nr:MBL fold metallo-hydrolase [Mogibacterium sp.]